MKTREIALRCALELINYVQIETMMPKGRKTIGYGELGRRIGYDNQLSGVIVGGKMCELKELCIFEFSKILGCKVPLLNALVVTADGEPTPDMFYEHPEDFEKSWQREIDRVYEFEQWDDVRLIVSCMMMADKRKAEKVINVLSC